MNKRTILSFILVTITINLFSCTTGNKKLNSAELSAYELAMQKSSHGELDSALLLLEKAFETDKRLNPMDIIQEKAFYPLVDSPGIRPKTRDLLKAFSKKEKANMVRAEEFGSRIFVIGRVINEYSQKPIENALVELNQAAQNGLYFEEQSLFNPRLFAFFKTTKNGEFSVETIQPGSYSGVASHIHFNISADGYRSYGSEFTFESDSIFRAMGNVDQVPVAYLDTADGQEIYRVTIPLQPEN
ncbi:MAG: hypothetical protein GY810_26655 [Aureispira sp.]|nr:hypothetical protein [Aureispira sp.]